MVIEHLGPRIRQLRKEQGITLTVMAEKTDLSVGYLSKLENDLTSPTIAHLHKICEALGLTINDILLEQPTRKNISIVRARDRKCLFEQDGLEYASLTQGHTILQATAMTIDSDDVFEFMPHAHDELGIVAKGVLELLIDGEAHRLTEGDSIYICAGTMHSARRASESACVSYWIKTASTVGTAQDAPAHSPAKHETGKSS